MKYGILAYCAALFWALPAIAQSQIKITGIAATKLTTNEVCTGAGGNAGFPTLTITHTKGVVGAFKVQLSDRISTGYVSDHRSFAAQASPTGKTVLTPEVLAKGGIIPPCNRSVHQFTSNYFWIVTSDGGSSERLWGKMTSGVIQ